MKISLVNLLIGTLLIISLGCKQDIVYHTEIMSYKTADFDLCKNQPCPIIDIDVLKLIEPAICTTTVNSWVRKKTLQSLQIDSSNSVSIKDALYHHINDSQISYPETTTSSTNHEIIIDSGISYNSNQLLSVYFNSYQFTGGASAYSSMTYLNINPSTGLEFERDNLLSEDFYAFAKAQILSDKTHDYTPTEVDHWTINQLGFTNSGVVVHYQNIADSYINANTYELLIAWKDAEQYLTF